MTQRTTRARAPGQGGRWRGSVAARFITKVARHRSTPQAVAHVALTGGVDGLRRARGRVNASPRARQRSTGRACTSGGATSAGCPRATPNATTTQARAALLDHLDLARRERPPVPGVRRGRRPRRGGRRLRGRARRRTARRLAAAELRHHASSASVPTGTSRRCSRDRAGIQVTDRDGHRRARLAQAAARAPQPHPAGHQRVRSASGWCSPAPTRRPRSDSRSPARARRGAGRRRQGPPAHRVLRRCGRGGRGARDAHRARLLTLHDARDARRRGRPLAGPFTSRVRVSPRSLPRRARSCVSASSSSVLGLLFGAALLHVGEVRLVRLELGDRRRVLLVATGGQARSTG